MVTRASVPGLGFVVLAVAAASACASVAARPVPSPLPFPVVHAAPPLEASEPSVATPPTPTRSEVIVQSALVLLGTPYRFGGATPERGFDCSGFVAYVLGQQAIAVPRSVADQFATGRPVARDELQAGDLIFFSTIGPGATHVGIVTDPARAEFIHAPADGSRVRVDRFDGVYWQPRWQGARRVF